MEGPKTLGALAVIAALAAPAAGQVVINEIHYDPPDKTVPAEFVELHNSGIAPADVSGWFFSDGIDFTAPDGTVIAPGEHLVVAQDPAVLESLHGDPPVVGPFTGRLDNDGELLVLRDRDGRRQDEVDYRRGFPWPVAGGSAGYSIELIHPGLENDLGGSWRPSNPALGQSEELIPAGSIWRYLKGTAEASNPRGAWRGRGFSDSGWGTGRTSIGYGESFITTSLDDMRNGYTSVFLRKTFEVADLASAVTLLLEVQYDDGFNAWINGVHVAGANLPSNDMPFDGTALSALENAAFEPFQPPSPSSYLVQGTNVLALQLFNASIGGSSDAFLDARLSSSDTSGQGPTPGVRNSIFAPEAPPQLREVKHSPAAPPAGIPVVITVKATDPDGVASVTLEYQVVNPGTYIRLTDPEYETGWTVLPMNDDGVAGDFLPLDGVYSGLVPAPVQVHRRLVRYRITAADGTGKSVLVPYPEDPQPNFAYFVYDGIPEWRGSVQPGSRPVRTFSAAVMSSIPAYQLIAREADVVNSQYNSSFEAVHFLGTMVYDGIVHDHMEFENRGEFSTYVSGKNKWRFHFNRAHDFQARDDYGRELNTAWRTMNVSGIASPWVPTNRGMAGLDEGAAFRLYGLTGFPTPATNYFQLRVIDEAAESNAADQYRGDLWGLYLTIEHTDGRFLEERGLPDGNTYKIEGGAGDKRNQGPTQVTDTSDYDALRNGYNVSQSITWWRANVDLEGYFGFRAIDRAVNNMDLREGWNICQYHNPETGRWTAIPWDLDMLYMPVTHWSGLMNFQNALTQHAELALEYRNRAREILDLLVMPDQLAQLAGEYAARVNPPGGPLTFADVDEAMWNYHPRAAGGHQGAFYRNPSTHSAIGGTITRTLVSPDLEGMAQWFKDFALEDYGYQQLQGHAADPAIPNRPDIAHAGPPGFPADGLTFRAGAFSDPNGNGTFAAMKWRLAEVTPAGAHPFDPLAPKIYEVNAVWESAELTTFNAEITIPPDVARIGGTYRARVRMKDATKRWSRWSPPVELIAGAPSVPFPQQEYLRITEIMFHPADDGDLEFIEVKNVGPVAVDLLPVSITGSVEFRFADGGAAPLGPGELVVVVKNLALFASWYDTAGMRIAGEYSGSLGNAGERLTLVHGPNASILDFNYDDWYESTDGGGYSLVIVDPLGPTTSWTYPDSWAASRDPGGSPGADEGASPTGGWQAPGDSNQDGIVEISDAVSLLLRLFGGAASPLPCDGGSISEAGNLALLDLNGDAGVDISDVIYLLGYLFKGGPPPARGARCVRIEGCGSECVF